MFDLVDVAREWLSMGPCLAVRDKINVTAAAPQLTADVDALLEVFDDVDQMMATNEGFLLGRWLQQSREVGLRRARPDCWLESLLQCRLDLFSSLVPLSSTKP
jgi:hypothetical protein